MKQLSVRFDAAEIEPRLDALRPHIQAENAGLTISRSKVLLFCLLEGLRRLERHYLETSE